MKREGPISNWATELTPPPPPPPQRPSPHAEMIKLAPDYNPQARQENKLYDERRVSEICPVRPPNEELADSLVWEYQANPGLRSRRHFGHGVQ